MIFLCPRWDMLIPWRVNIFTYSWLVLQLLVPDASLGLDPQFLRLLRLEQRRWTSPLGEFVFREDSWVGKNGPTWGVRWYSQIISNTMFFPTCQVRVVRFYVSLFSSSFSFSFSSCRPPPRRISTAILWVQCGVLDPNRDPASAVWRAGPQPRSC